MFLFFDIWMRTTLRKLPVISSKRKNRQISFREKISDGVETMLRLKSIFRAATDVNRPIMPPWVDVITFTQFLVDVVTFFLRNSSLDYGSQRTLKVKRRWFKTNTFDAESRTLRFKCLLICNFRYDNYLDRTLTDLVSAWSILNTLKWLRYLLDLGFPAGLHNRATGVRRRN